MTNAVALILVVLSCRGYWFGGTEARVTLAWAVDKPPAAVVAWELMADQAKLAHGQVDMPAGKGDAVIKITVPEVRVRTKMKWIYRLLAPDDKHVLAKGESVIEVFPRDLLAGLEKRTEGKSIVLVDESPVLTRVLKSQKIVHKSVASLDQILMTKPNVILVGIDQFHGKAFEQSPLLGQAAAGASVMVFCQSDVKMLAGYPVEVRRIPAGTQPAAAWKIEKNHTLLRGLSDPDLRSLMDGTTVFRAVQLPADEPAFEVVYWPRETPGLEPVPVDALLITKAVGSGRLVLCQIPLGDWETDPRSQLLLANLLDYLLTRPEPTIRPSERPVPDRAAPAPTSNILVPSGSSTSP